MLLGIKKLRLRAMNKKVDPKGLVEKNKGGNSNLHQTEVKRLPYANLSKGLRNKKYLFLLMCV